MRDLLITVLEKLLVVLAYGSVAGGAVVGAVFLTDRLASTSGWAQLLVAVAGVVAGGVLGLLAAAVSLGSLAVLLDIRRACRGSCGVDIAALTKEVDRLVEGAVTGATEGQEPENQ